MAIGIEIDAALVALSRRKIQEQSLQQRAAIVHQDWLSVSMGSVDVVFLFFLPHQDIARLLQQKLRPGTRVITYVFQIQQWTPKQIVATVPFMTDHGQSFIYLYDLPEPMQA
jgi:tRNA A58 N-methylase Trm61